jgi:hypothetical protein
MLLRQRDTRQKTVVFEIRVCVLGVYVSDKGGLGRGSGLKTAKCPVYQG